MDTPTQTNHTMDTQTPHTLGKQRPHRLSTYLRGIVCLAAVLACAPCSTYASETPSDVRELCSQVVIGVNTFNGMGVKQDEGKGAALIRDAINKGVEKALEETKDASGMVYLGRCYSNGIGVEKDATKALYWYRKSIEIDPHNFLSDEAEYRIGLCYLEGTGIEKDETQAAIWLYKAAGGGSYDAKKLLRELAPERAARWYRIVADAGNDDAMYELGKCYLEGRGERKDAAQAAEWFKKAADDGHPAAMYELGKCYLEGTGVEKDEQQAVEWFKKATEDGEKYAMYALGKCYLEGRGVDKDAAQAVEWFKKAAENWNYDAMCALGKCYLDGIGIAKDETQAAKWICKAARVGNTDAQELLRKLAPEKTAHLYQLAIEDGEKYAMYALGKCYLEGRGVGKDAAQAVEWFKKAAERRGSWFIRKAGEAEGGQAFPGAMYELGKCYLNGIGVEKDGQQAKYWLQEAADKGNTDAKELLQKLEQK